MGSVSLSLTISVTLSPEPYISGDVVRCYHSRPTGPTVLQFDRSRNSSRMVAVVIVAVMLLASSTPLNAEQLVVQYLNDHFLLPAGCPSTDPMVQEFYRYCMEEHGDETVCVSDQLRPGRFLTFPKFTNHCSAICHGFKFSRFKKCPYKGKIVSRVGASQSSHNNLVRQSGGESDISQFLF